MTTRLVDGACIFLNRPGHPGGAGCALHRAAIDRGVPPLRLKPDVCWQLPLRREDAVVANGHVTSSLGEWGRRHWGEGGAEFSWWCTEAPEAFNGGDPVYISLRDELVAMVGQDVYDLLASYLGTRTSRRGQAVSLLAHPTVRAFLRRHERREQSRLTLSRAGSVAVNPVVRSVALYRPGSRSARSDGTHRLARARPAPLTHKGTRRHAPPRGRPHTRDTAPLLLRLRASGCAPLRNADDVPFSRAAPKISRMPPQTAAMR